MNGLPLDELIAHKIKQQDRHALEELASEVEAVSGTAAAQKLIQWRSTDVSPLLHVAANESHCPSLLRALLGAGADPNYPRRPDGDTALHQAVAGKDAECIRVLLSAGADPLVQNVAGVTPLDAAAKKRLPAVHDLSEKALFHGCVAFKVQAGPGFPSKWKARYVVVFQTKACPLSNR